jgi:hypothetical protein
MDLVSYHLFGGLLEDQVPGTLSLVVKRPGREAVHSPPSSAEVKEWLALYLHSPNTPSWRGALLKHRDNFTFTFSNAFFTYLVRVLIHVLSIPNEAQCLSQYAESMDYTFFYSSEIYTTKYRAQREGWRGLFYITCFL